MSIARLGTGKRCSKLGTSTVGHLAEEEQRLKITTIPTAGVLVALAVCSRQRIVFQNSPLCMAERKVLRE